MMTPLPIISVIPLKNKTTIGILIAVGIVTPAVMGYYLLSNPFRPRAATPITPVTPVTGPTTVITGGGTGTPKPISASPVPTGVYTGIVMLPLSDVPKQSGKANISITPLTIGPNNYGSFKIQGNVFGMKPFQQYRFKLCSGAPKCTGLAVLFNFTMDKSGTALINQTFSAQLGFDGIQIDDAKLPALDTDYCNNVGGCLYSTVKVIAPTTTKPTAISTQVPTRVPPSPTPTRVSPPDLTVRAITRDNLNYYYVEYCNSGKGNTSQKISVKLYNQTTKRTFNTPATLLVPAAGQCTRTGGITCGLVGSTCKDNALITATADGTNVVNEYSESNNSKTQAFTGVSARVTQTPAPTRYPVNAIVYAAGTPVGGGYPNMTVELDGVQVYTNVARGGNYGRRSFIAYPFTASLAKKPSTMIVRFTNDGYAPPEDRNLFIDKVVLNGVTYEAEATNVYSTGGYTSKTGCAAGYKATETLACTGYLQFTLR